MLDDAFITVYNLTVIVLVEIELTLKDAFMLAWVAVLSV